MGKIKIAIAEDHDIVRFGMVKLLAGYKDIKVSFQVKNGQQLLIYLEKTPVDIILLDIKMPEVSGDEALPKIKQYFPKTKIIVVSAYSEDDLIIKYSNLGANGFLAKGSDVKTIVKAIYEVNEKGFFYEDKVLALVRDKSSFPLIGFKKLNPKEQLVLSYLCRSMGTARVAKELKAPESSIIGYRYRIMQKTGATNEQELIEYAKVQGYKII